MKALVLYATQLIERTHLQQQAATVTSVIEIQRQCKSVPMVITSICTTIRHTLQCEYVSLYKVESTRMRQLYPDNCTIHSFNDGILGYVAKKQHFILFNNNKEKESLGIGQLDIEEDMKVDHVQSLICVPIFSKDLKDICGIILIINTHSKFTHLEIDVIQLLGIEIGRILETSGTTLLINDAIENSVNGDVTRSMLHFYRASEINPLMIPAISHSVSSPEAKEVSRIKDHLSQLSDMESQTPPSEIKTSVTSDTEMFTVERTVSDLFMRRRSTLTRMRPITERQDSNSLVDKNRGDPLWRSASTPSKPKKLATAFERDESGYEIKEQVTDTSDVTHADELTDEISKPSNSGPVECVRRNSGNMFEQRRGSLSGTLQIAEVLLKKQSIVAYVNSTTKPLQQMVGLTFDPFTCNEEDICRLTVKIFDDLDLINGLKIPIMPFVTFIKQITGLYGDANPYHNLYHGFSVLSFTYSFIKKTTLGNMQKLDLFAILIAALSHDVDHPGNTNAFEIATNSEFARLHNDQSVLENHHCNVTFKTLYREDCNFITHFSNQDRKTFRTRVIQAILATDMSHHFALCRTLDQIDKAQFQQNMASHEKNDKFKQMVVNMLLHTADLTAPCQPLLLALKWGKKVCQEFTNQVKKESELGIESLPMMIGLEERENFLKSQNTFIKFVLRPLFKQVARLLPQLNHLYLQLLNNEQFFSDELEKINCRDKAKADMNKVRVPTPLGSSNRKINMKQRRFSTSSMHSSKTHSDVFANVINSVDSV
eukprot:1004538_1